MLVRKAYAYGAKLFTMSDSNGCIYDENGIDLELIKQVKKLSVAELVDIQKLIRVLNILKEQMRDSPVWKIKQILRYLVPTQNELAAI